MVFHTMIAHSHITEYSVIHMLHLCLPSYPAPKTCAVLSLFVPLAAVFCGSSMHEADVYRLALKPSYI